MPSPNNNPPQIALSNSPKPMTQRKVMAFDFGTRKIGVAIGQELTGTAQPLAPLAAQNGIPDWGELEKRIDEWKPDALVVGMPINMDGTASEMSIRANKFRNRLHGRFHLPSYSMDERLSSREARDKKDSGITRHRKNLSIDSLSATLILESWFSEQSAAHPDKQTGENE